MGSLSITVTAVGGVERVVLEAQIDRRATHLVLPGDVIAKIGAQPSETRRFKRSDSRRVEIPFGSIELTLGDQTHRVGCIHADSGATPIIGDQALAPFGLMVDASTGEVVSIASELLRSEGVGRPAIDER
jgi:predicted aspartyl protease